MIRTAHTISQLGPERTSSTAGKCMKSFWEIRQKVIITLTFHLCFTFGRLFFEMHWQYEFKLSVITQVLSNCQSTARCQNQADAVIVSLFLLYFTSAAVYKISQHDRRVLNIGNNQQSLNISTDATPESVWRRLASRIYIKQATEWRARFSLAGSAANQLVIVSQTWHCVLVQRVGSEL